jgi:predicted RNA-binding protein with RPS1 domain
VDISVSTREAVALLREQGAEGIEHPGGTLLSHLERVRERLAAWGARPALQLAGLCHAFYGTDGFAASLLPLERRGELAAVIGAEAGELVYFYASCDRGASYATLADEGAAFRDRFTGETYTPSLRRRQDFAELTAANELDLARANESFRAEWGGELLRLFTRWRRLLSDAAWEDAREVLVLRGEERQAFLRGLERGDVRTGVVSHIASFGVTFVELGGVEAQMNIPEVSWSRMDHLSDVLREGQELAFTVLGVDMSRERVSLSLKDLAPDPMREFARTRLGDVMSGRVTKVAPVGVFVDVWEGVEGLVPVDDLAGRELQPGDEVDVEISAINVNLRRVRLALR